MHRPRLVAEDQGSLYWGSNHPHVEAFARRVCGERGAGGLGEA
jgi:hypothetical protein